LHRQADTTFVLTLELVSEKRRFFRPVAAFAPGAHF
jgi:hypothetical protein